MAPRRLARQLSDVIELGGIRAFGRHGADPGEKQVPQPFVIDVRIELDLAAARRTDRLDDTLDYAALHRSIVQLVHTTSFDLIERLGQEILTLILRDERVASAQVRIAKPQLLAGATPAVLLEQQR